tara:strand:+ start:809 stop:2596 length:1788 start_codon:yes stop_codon:yes gene_type:complete
MDLPKPPGEKESGAKPFASHETMGKSFGLQRKTLARVIGLEKRVDAIESGGGISIEKFTEINQSIVTVNNNLKAIGDALTAELVADKEAARDDKIDSKREIDKLKKSKAEKFLELKNEKELVKPADKAVAKSKNIFQRLFDAFSAIFGGFILDKGAKMLEAWKDGDMEKFNKMKNTIIKSLVVAGSIFAAVNLVGIIGSLKLLIAGLKVGIPGVLALLANPWTWVVLGVGVGMYFGFKTLKKAITGGGEFENFDSNLREGTEAAGLDVKNMGTGALFLDPETKKPIRVKMWEGDTGANGDDKYGSLMGRPINLAAGDTGKNMSAEINIINPGHRKWIIDNYGEAALANADKRYQNYINSMHLKETMVKNMQQEFKDSERLLRLERYKESKASGIDVTDTSNPAANQFRKDTAAMVKAKHVEIRAKYEKNVRLQFPELFDDDITTMPALEDSQKKFLFETKDDGSVDFFENPNFEGYVGNKKNQWWDFMDVKENQKKELPPSFEKLPEDKTVSLSSSSEISRELNNEKISSISFDSDSSPNFEIIPFSSGMDQNLAMGEGGSMNMGDASELPNLFTHNTDNDYRFFYSHIYQQGDT